MEKWLLPNESSMLCHSHLTTVARQNTITGISQRRPGKRPLPLSQWLLNYRPIWFPWNSVTVSGPARTRLGRGNLGGSRGRQNTEKRDMNDREQIRRQSNRWIDIPFYTTTPYLSVYIYWWIKFCSCAHLCDINLINKGVYLSCHVWIFLRSFVSNTCLFWTNF